MRTRVDAALRAEASEFALRFTCEHCAHFDAARGTCAEGFPNAEHRGVLLEGLEEGDALVFCKSFELA